MRHRYRISILLIGLLMLVGNLSIGSIRAFGVEETPDVEIRLEQVRLTDQDIQADLEICFSDMKYYNDYVYLSYHIFDAGDNLVIGENERVKIELDAGQRQSVSLQIDMSDAKILAPDEKLYVEFDIVDEGNAFWYSTSDELIFRTARVDFSRSVLQKVTDEMQGNVIIFAVNIIVFILVCSLGICYFMRWRKEQKA